MSRRRRRSPSTSRTSIPSCAGRSRTTPSLWNSMPRTSSGCSSAGHPPGRSRCRSSRWTSTSTRRLRSPSPSPWRPPRRFSRTRLMTLMSSRRASPSPPSRTSSSSRPKGTRTRSLSSCAAETAPRSRARAKRAPSTAWNTSRRWCQRRSSRTRCRSSSARTTR